MSRQAALHVNSLIPARAPATQFHAIRKISESTLFTQISRRNGEIIGQVEVAACG